MLDRRRRRRNLSIKLPNYDYCQFLSHSSSLLLNYRLNILNKNQQNDMEKNMKYHKKVIVPVLLEENAVKYLSGLKDMESLRHAEVHFVHIFQTITYSFALAAAPLVYPVESDRKMIEESATSLLDFISKKVLGDKFEGKIVLRTFFSENEKKSFTSYVKEQNPSLVIIPTKSKHGIFESSFAAYVNKNTETDVLMIKHH